MGKNYDYVGSFNVQLSYSLLMFKRNIIFYEFITKFANLINTYQGELNKIYWLTVICQHRTGIIDSVSTPTGREYN